jgi:ABC-type sugar transport system substrate-binding protein
MKIETSKGVVAVAVVLSLVAGLIGGLVPIAVVKLTAPEPAPVVAEVAPVVTEPAREGTYYFLAGNNADPFYVDGVKGFNEAAKSVGMKAEFVGPMDLNLAAQMKTFEELIASPETKGIFWYPMDFNAGEPFIKEAVAKGIPMVIGAADSPFKTRNAFIGYNNTVLGQQAAQWAAKLIDCKGEVGTISVNGPNLDERVKGFNEYLKSICPDVVIDERATHDGSAASEASTLEAYMIAHPDLTLLWWADGAAGIQAQIWKDKQDQGVKTLFLATDMPQATLQAVKDDVFVGTVAQDTWTEEFFAVILMDYLSKGYRVPDTVYLSALLIDKNNVDKFLTK